MVWKKVSNLAVNNFLNNHFQQSVSEKKAVDANVYGRVNIE